MKVSEIFKKEISFIKNEDLQNIVACTLDVAPECIAFIPASSSGKYHPKADIVYGEFDSDGDIVKTGGLVNHIKTVTALCRSLMDSDNFRDIVFGIEDAQDYKLHIFEDIALAACILHDCCKPNNTPKHGTVFDHPLKAAELFKSTAKEYIRYNNIKDAKLWTMIISLTASSIASHMGKWSTAPYAKGIVLPKPKLGIEVIVHMCDYIASRKFIDFNFDVYEKTYNNVNAISCEKLKK